MKLSFFQAGPRPIADRYESTETLIRSELFSVERLEQHAESLAAAQGITARPRPRQPLQIRLQENDRILREAYLGITAALNEGRAIPPAAEWLADNYFVLEEQVRNIRNDLPSGFYRELPKLAEGPLAGYPRVFGLAWAFIAHSDSRFEPEMLARFVRAYQRVVPLTIGELWAIAITLRIVLVENLRRASTQIMNGRIERRKADALADILLGPAATDMGPVETLLRHIGKTSLSSAFAVQLVQRLRDQGPNVALMLQWLEERLLAQGVSTEEIVQQEHQEQGALNVTVRNVIISMRLISAIDWTKFVESVSLVDDVLRAGSSFAAMDFPTRDLYRRSIEKLARGSGRMELDVAERALRATAMRSGGSQALADAVAVQREDDPGYVLIGKGRPAFERDLGFRPSLFDSVFHAIMGAGIAGYLLIICSIAFLFVDMALSVIRSGNASLALLFVLAVFSFFPALEAAVALVNRIISYQFPPSLLPALELESGVPENCRTMIVVPVLLTSAADVEGQIESLEVHHLANAIGDFRFALLSDWTDANTESAPEDDALLAAAIAGIGRLNERYGPAHGGDRFFLFHRRRRWNESHGKWMGWERKRGKLHELNRLLRGAADTTFLTPSPASVPAGIRYIITLDADTRLPRGAARKLVGKMAHALNRPRIEPATGRVTEGYGILQPRVTSALPEGSDGSLLQRAFSSASGIDPYAFAVSDVYQDLFGEGSFSGKGIYDVDAFEAALDARIPENTLLSHDLLEGIFARAGLVSDIEVVEEFPAHYDVATARQHRWARGDWQLLPWIFGKAKTAIPPVGRWKMIDNLRRTLTFPCVFLAVLLGWTLPAGPACAWTALMMTMLAAPLLLPFLEGIMPRRTGISLLNYLHVIEKDALRLSQQLLFMIAFLPHQAALMADAILRTLNRMFRTRRNLLEWTTAAQTKVSRNPGLFGFYRQMASGIALALLALWVSVENGTGMLAAPFVILWLGSPILARWASLPPVYANRHPLSSLDRQALRLIARRTWRFFETFVTSADNMLPPDNFQEDPAPVVAHRTSPTNIGLYLLSVVAARDFNWSGTRDTVDRLVATMDTMAGMERFRGHFYNWYDTVSLIPLVPRYISSVDSGNLGGHLIVLASACREMIRSPIVNPEWFLGPEDALALIREFLPSIERDRRTQTVTRKQLDDSLHGMAAVFQAARAAPATLANITSHLAEAARYADVIMDIVNTLTAEQRGASGASADMRVWAEILRENIRSHRRDLELLVLPMQANVAGNELAENWRDLFGDKIPTLGEFLDRGIAVKQSRSADFLKKSLPATQTLERNLTSLAARADEMFKAMEFGFLLDPTRRLLSIGYRPDDNSLDSSSYDLLASEARLASFIAIAKGDVPTSHWFRLGRAVTPIGYGSALISWSGSMFEYLMPSLVMREPPESLIGQTNSLVVRRQISYGTERGIPWGISESAYNARDMEFTYQYSNFGIPGLGLKRGLSENIVVAPYATALASMLDPKAVVQNMARLDMLGGRGRYGWYEAIDYTKHRVPEGAEMAIVRAYMAHHQGMSVVAILNAVKDGVMRSRFHAEPIVQATELLLQERPPRNVDVARPRFEEVEAVSHIHEIVAPNLRRFHSPHASIPGTHLLSNGRYVVMMTAAGSGYSRWEGLAVTRWREDVTCDAWGSYIYVRDAGSGDVWSAAYHPVGVEADSYDVAFSEDRAEIIRRDGTIKTVLEVAVSPEHNGEVRRVSIVNLGENAREIELTSYAELVLANPLDDLAHPAFSKLFVQTEFVADIGALLATRRLRSPDEPQVWAAHMAVIEGETIGDMQFETDRARFLGRGHNTGNPVSVIDGRPLSNTTGTVLDPVFSLRCRLRIPAGSTARVAFWTLIAPSRGEALDLADKHRDAAAFERAVTRAWTQAQLQLQYLDIGADEAHLFQRLANHIIYSNPALRPPSEALKKGPYGPSTLWPFGISGDLPIVLVRIDQADDIGIVRQLLRAHAYWTLKQLAVDLVILNERATSYLQDLQGELEMLARASQSTPGKEGKNLKGAIFVLRNDLVTAEARSLLQTAARAVLLSRRGSLSEQLKALPRDKGITVAPPRKHALATPTAPIYPTLEFFNGLGGFDKDGREYVTIINHGQWTPAPWLNVIANPGFGFHVSVDGSGATWAINSRENRLTPWSNDPVSDAPGEAIYIRDEDSGRLWTPTALPIREEDTSYTARHGQGYSCFEHTSNGITVTLTQYVPLSDPIKISRLKIRERAGRARRLSVTAYVEWVLGASRAVSAPFIVTEIDRDTGVMLARNPWNDSFGARVAFVDLCGEQRSWTGDRREFIGRNSSLSNPAALAPGQALSNRTGAGFDPCSVLQAPVKLGPHGEVEIVFLLGETGTATEALDLVRNYRAADLESVLRGVIAHWDAMLEVVQVHTPDRAMDIMQNRWLLYQTIVCRVWARSAFYQASGAYGYRDQLQDTMALTLTRPDIAREHLLRAAGRQFVEGDVQHWWLPSGRTAGQGVRTLVSDDRFWLPYAVAHYVKATGDIGVLDEDVLFLEGPVLAAGEHESFFLPRPSASRGTLFDHCALALDGCLKVGPHGLPLIGTGDWNDGMNRVGAGGKGESVWLGWFVIAAIREFAPLAEAGRDPARAAEWRKQTAALQEALERDGWDGDWYRRGFFDDGTPFGSIASSECRIDSIAQSWAVLADASDPARAAQAMRAMEQQLVRPDEGLALLFTPPFDQTPLDPGYIKGYPAGIRENGGQYTHAALWSVMALAKLGEGDRAGALLSMLNPVNHANTRTAIHRYKTEPYVVAADVYAASQHTGRGGWTWYTGSAAWMYRATLESVLGFRVQGTDLHLAPCIPRAWPEFSITFRYRSSRYEIDIHNPDRVSSGIVGIVLDNVARAVNQDGKNQGIVPLVDDGKIHHIQVTLGNAP